MARKPNTLAALESAESELLAARNRVITATADQKNKRKTLADAIITWQGAFPLRDSASVYREHLKRQADRELAIRRGEIEADDTVEIMPSHIDAVMRSGRGGSINFGYRRPAAGLRGPKVPAAR